MKHIASLLAIAFTLLTAPLRAEVRISFDFFHDSLNPYGDWMEVGGYGRVWQPRGVDADWAPYTDGYWTFTDAGWTWVSYEDFGGICYHYGRWVMLDEFGWCWVPGYEWGPGWVSWRKNDDYVGWAPLPPEAHWRREHGFGVWVDTHFDIGPGLFSFCRTRDFGAPVLRHVCLPRSRNVTIIADTVNITNITYNSDYGVVYNGGFDYDYIAPRCERRVPVLKLVQNTTNVFITGNSGNVFINSPQGNALVVGAPQLADSNYNVLTRKVEPRRTIAQPVISRGWAGLDKGEVRKRLLVKMRDEHQGLTPERAPARAFNAAAVNVVPKKADLTAKSPASLLKKPVSRRVTADANPGDEPLLPGAGRAPVEPTVKPGAAPAGDEPKTRPGRTIVRPSDNDRDEPSRNILKPAVEPREKPVAADDEPKRPLRRPESTDDARTADEPVKKSPSRLITPRTVTPDSADEKVTPKRTLPPARDNAADDARERSLAEAAAKRREAADRERAEDAARRQKMIEDRGRSIEKQQNNAAEAARRAAAERAEDGRRNEAAQRAAEARERQAEAASRAAEARRAQAAEAARRTIEVPRRVVPTRPAPVTEQPRVMPSRPAPSRPLPSATVPRLIPSSPKPAVPSTVNPIVVPKKKSKRDE